MGTLAAAPAAQAATNDPLYSKLWGLQQVKAEQAWASSTGTGAVVAVVDTGIDFSQPDLQGQILQGATFTGCPKGQRPCGNGDFRGPDGQNDEDEHGTHGRNGRRAPQQRRRSRRRGAVGHHPAREGARGRLGLLRGHR